MRKLAPCSLVLAALAGAEEALDEEWVASDVAAARRVAGALSETKLPTFLEKLGSASTEEDRDIGFGARRLRLAVYGGYTTTWVTVVSWDGGVGPLEVSCHEEAEVWAGIRDRIKAEYKGHEPEVGDTGLRV
ncbi:MAG: hypothetical protein L6Q95_19400, partial [Planctomycetes bacterium]|nr:hypothetical protein [Planctomycetota bacterium]